MSEQSEPLMDLYITLKRSGKEIIFIDQPRSHATGSFVRWKNYVNGKEIGDALGAFVALSHGDYPAVMVCLNEIASIHVEGVEARFARDRQRRVKDEQDRAYLDDLESRSALNHAQADYLRKQTAAFDLQMANQTKMAKAVDKAVGTEFPGEEWKDGPKGDDE